MSYCDLIDSKYTPTTAFMFKGTVNTPEELDTLENCQDGDVVMISSTSQMYCHIGDGWELISCLGNEESLYDEKPITIVERKCNNCGAPLKMQSKYSDTCHCEYCGSTFYTY